MKPIEHPEFFRRPPPEGRSRESTLVLDERGRFWHDGRPVEHAGMQEAFAGWIRKHPDDGRYILCNGYDWTYLQVLDAPLFVRAVATRGPEPELVFSDGSRQPLRGAHLRVVGEEALYVEVRGRDLEARFLPPSQAALSPFVEEGEEGRPVLCVAGVVVPIEVDAPPPASPGDRQ